MLLSLSIKNLALVEDLALEIQAGFTVLTGETGAGKSLLVDALSLLVGARADGDLVRAGTDRAVAEAVVDGNFQAWSAFLSAHGFPEEQPVVIRREVGAGGRSRAWINGAACNLTDLKESARIWIRLTSQHDHQSLLAEERHLGLLDEVLGIRADLTRETEDLREAMARLKARRRSEAERGERLEWLAEQVQDLDKLGPRPGEWMTLRSEREPLRHAVQMAEAFREAAEGLGEAQPGAALAHRALQRCAAILPDVQSDVDRMRSLTLELEDLLALAQDQARKWSREGTDRVEILEARLAQYEKLARRHRCEPEELAGRLQAFRDEQKALLGGDSAVEALEADLAKAAETYRTAAAALHERRSASLPPLEREVHLRLGHLGMGGARLQARLSLAQDPASPVLHQGLPVRVTPQGFSSLAFWIESNAGEGFRPLARIASGGELSRLMLALLGTGSALGEAGPREAGPREAGPREAGPRNVGPSEPLTLVLDEVDAGIGGETAIAVGAAIRELGRVHQVLAVTHLAQVAARADHHGLLRKETRDGRTRSGLAWMEAEARIQELARLLSGHPDRPEAREHARALLERP
jgi:DNA repair protein RecN (Recombination protein N)